jgi:hypothetical protein
VGETTEDLIPASEVQGIIDKAVEAAVQRHLASVRQVADAGFAAGPPGGGWMQELAVQLALMNDQGRGIAKRVDPGVLKARGEAKARMDALIERAQEQKTAPVYELENKTYLDNQLISHVWVDRNHVQQKTQIQWYAEPNFAMRPVNDVAQAIYDEYLAYQGTSGIDTGSTVKVTRGGLAITKGPSQMLKMELPHTGAESTEDGELGVKIVGRGPSGTPGTRKATNILGTIHPPAVNNV